MNFKKEYGWDIDKVEKLRMIVNGTRDAMKHTIFGMRQTTAWGEYYIRAVDRSGMTPFVIAESKAYDTRDEMTQAYNNLIIYFDLPYCCVVHREELQGFFDEENEDDDFFAGYADPDDGFFADDEEDEGDFFEDDPNEDFFS